MFGPFTFMYMSLCSWLKVVESGRKCVTRADFSHMQRFLSKVSNTSNTLNVLLMPHVSNIVVHFNLIN